MTTLTTPRRNLLRNRASAGTVILAAALLLLPGPAAALTLDVGEDSGQVGTIVELPIVLSDLGGESVWSYELDLSWYASYAELLDVTTTGTLSATWVVDRLIDPGAVTVTAAGATPLAGDGTLLLLRFLLGPSAGGMYVYLNDALLNEGDPVPTLDGGYVTVTALPTVDIYPDSGLLVVGDSLQFTTYGGTPPYTYTSSDPAVADFTDDWLHALSPGFVRAYTEDAAAITDSTYYQIEVRPFRLSVVAGSAAHGDTVLIPVEIDDPAAYGVVSAEFDVTWYSPYADFLEVETAGTLMATAGWSTPLAVSSPGVVSVAAAGVNPLPGPGVLLYLRMVVYGSYTFTPGAGIFNETYAAYPLGGYWSVTPAPTIGISPATANLMVYETQQFTATGTPTPPLTWSVDDPGLAFIDGTGLMIALAEGVVHVQVEDALGAVATSGDITICYVGLPTLVSSIDALEIVQVPVYVSYDLDGLGIYSYEIAVYYNPAYVHYLGTVTAGSASAGWGAATAVDDGSLVRVYHAGPVPLDGCGSPMFYVEFQGDAGLGSPYTGVALSTALFNEGTPCVRINTGDVCDPATDASPPPAGPRLWPARPNPFNPRTVICFQLDRTGHAELDVFSARGERIRRLVDGVREAGRVYEVPWDGRDDAGNVLASGVYYCRLVAAGETRLQKLALLK